MIKCVQCGEIATFHPAPVMGETMETIKSRFIGMNSNQLKIVALLAMTCDHIGKQLLPQITILQIIGRLAFPIFALIMD